MQQQRKATTDAVAHPYIIQPQPSPAFEFGYGIAPFVFLGSDDLRRRGGLAMFRWFWMVTK